MLSLGIALSGLDPVRNFEQILAAAQAAEASGFDFLLLPERVGLDPIALAAGLAATTERIGLIPSCTAPFHQPYNLARRLGSIDHISHGRFGWALQAMPTAEEADRFGHLTLPAPKIAAARAAELAEVVAGLWDSWDDDAFMRDKASGLYFDRAKFHWLNHEGPHYRVRGPLDTARPPQGRPPLMVEGDAGDLAATAAEIWHTAPRHLTEARQMRAAITQRLAERGRSADALRHMPGIAPNDAAVRNGPMRLGETPAMIAAIMQEWHACGAADGFILHLPDAPASIDALGGEVIAALRQRGLRGAAPASTQLRARLGLPPAPSRYATRAA